MDKEHIHIPCSANAKVAAGETVGIFKNITAKNEKNLRMFIMKKGLYFLLAILAGLLCSSSVSHAESHHDDEAPSAHHGNNNISWHWDKKCTGSVPAGTTVVSIVEVQRFSVPAANQGIAVDRDHFYAIDNRVITKHRRDNGVEVARWEWTGNSGRILVIHMDGGVVIGDKLYVAHSNWDEWPMTSSVEIFDTETMEHIGTHSFGERWGSLTWIDWYDGYWWAVFANYNRFKDRPDPANPDGYDVLPGNEDQRISVKDVYGYKRRTALVKMNRDFVRLEGWVLPDEILIPERTGSMSISGGSWGPDGYLYLTGHDSPELYKCKLPTFGATLELVDVINLRHNDSPVTIEDVMIRGQGIAWDRTGDCHTIYGIIRAEESEEDQGITNQAVEMRATFERMKDM